MQVRHIQLREYVELLAGGAGIEPVTPELAEACLAQAESLWEELQLGRWNDHPRNVELVVRCQGEATRLVHVTANWPNSFLIFVVPAEQPEPSGFLLFDIGAEYAGTRLICPDLHLDCEPTEELIRQVLPQLTELADSFVILEQNDATYLQAFAEEGRYQIEHQLVSLAAHYVLSEPATADEAVAIFLSYAFGKKEWATAFRWEKMKLKL